MPFIVAILLVAAAVGGGVSLEASRALPGDALYPFKVGINERAEGLVARGGAAQAQLNVALAQERLDEAQQLAQENKLTAATQSQLTQNFTAHITEASTTMAQLTAQGDIQTAVALATQLHAMLVSEVATLQDASSQGSVARQVSLVPVLVEARKVLAASSAASVAFSAKAIEASANISK